MKSYHIPGGCELDDNHPQLVWILHALLKYTLISNILLHHLRWFNNCAAFSRKKWNGLDASQKLHRCLLMSGLQLFGKRTVMMQKHWTNFFFSLNRAGGGKPWGLVDAVLHPPRRAAHNRENWRDPGMRNPSRVPKAYAGTSKSLLHAAGVWEHEWHCGPLQERCCRERRFWIWWLSVGFRTPCTGHRKCPHIPHAKSHCR